MQHNGAGKSPAEVYRHFQSQLLQITRRNRSITLSRTTNKNNFDLAEADRFKPGTASKISDKAVKNIAASMDDNRDPGPVASIILDSVEDEDADSSRSKLRTLSRNLQQIEDETGIQAGYLGFPFLQGKLEDDFYVRGPLVLFPMQVQYKRQAKGAGWHIHLEDKRPILNDALITCLKKKGHDIPKDYEEKFSELLEKISSETAVVKLENIDQFFFVKILKWASEFIEIKDEYSQSSPIPLNPIRRSDIPDLTKPFHLVNYKIIGSFPQAGNEIYKDYMELIDQQDSECPSIVRRLIGSDAEFADAENDEPQEQDMPCLNECEDKNLNLVLESDPSQDEAILASKKSEAVAVWGPPGTGKSQMIVNLISDALAGGEKVLVVCQKRAALEVVKQRLAQVGLDRYAVFLEKELDDRRKMYDQLAGIIDAEPAASYAKKNLAAVSAMIDKSVRHLSELGDALKEPHFGGATAHKIYLRAKSGYTAKLSVEKAAPDLTWDKLDAYVQKIAGLEDSFKKFEDEDYPWFGRMSFAGMTNMEKNKTLAMIKSMQEMLPQCLLASSYNEHKNLLLHSEECCKSRGFLKVFARKKAIKAVRQIMSNEIIDDRYIGQHIEKIRKGEEFWEEFSKLSRLFSIDASKSLESLSNDSGKLNDRLGQMHSSLDDDAEDMQELDKNKEQDNMGAFLMLKAAKDALERDDDWAKSIEQEIYAYWLNEIEKKRPILTGRPVAKYEEEKAGLKERMGEKPALVRAVIEEMIEGAAAPGSSGRRGSLPQVWRDLKKDLKRRRSVKPVRQMFEKYGKEMFQIAPCWLASPEAVSKVFPLQKGLFDLIIADEASQIAVERSIPFICRAKRVVVAGDEKQMPPFDLFQMRDGDDVDEEMAEQIGDTKSLLDLFEINYLKKSLT